MRNVTFLAMAGFLVAASVSGVPKEPPTFTFEPADELHSQGGFRNIRLVHYDAEFLFVTRHYGDARDWGGNTKPGVFVHSATKNRWIRILAISTEGGRFGHCLLSDGPTCQRLPVGWDDRPLASRKYAPQPLPHDDALLLPREIRTDASRAWYYLHYHPQVPGGDTILRIARADVVAAFRD
jgi:hypothetical protein